MNRGAVTAFFLTTVIATALGVLFLLAVSAGRAGLCKVYEGQPTTFAYCHTAGQR